MADPDPTDLNATQRDLLVACGAAMNGRERPPNVPEVRRIAIETSQRFSSERTGKLHTNLGYLESEGYVQTRQHPDDNRKKQVGITPDGEQAIKKLAERSAEAAAGEDNNE